LRFLFPAAIFAPVAQKAITYHICVKNLLSAPLKEGGGGPISQVTRPEAMQPGVQPQN
jgi:hypothetical protein